MIWSRPKTLWLYELAALGMTGRQIADRMGMTREQVIGKAWRDGLVLGAGEPRNERVKRGMAYARALVSQEAA